MSHFVLICAGEFSAGKTQFWIWRFSTCVITDSYSCQICVNKHVFAIRTKLSLFFVNFVVFFDFESSFFCQNVTSPLLGHLKIWENFRENEKITYETWNCLRCRCFSSKPWFQQKVPKFCVQPTMLQFKDIEFKIKSYGQPCEKIV